MMPLPSHRLRSGLSNAAPPALGLLLPWLEASSQQLMSLPCNLWPVACNLSCCHLLPLACNLLPSSLLFRIGINHNLPFIPQINRLEVLELLSPLRYMCHIELESRQEVRVPQVYRYPARIVGCHFDVLWIGEVHFAQLLRISGALRVQLPHQAVVNFHGGRARRERLSVGHAFNDGKG